jgi:D-serine deaminase-like pyridoxal phosphate-dependent protein
MAERMALLPADLRPHIKLHKSPELARRQVEAGAVGLSCATVWEAAILAAEGLDDLFVVNTVAGADKLRVVATLARERIIHIAVDQLENARMVGAAATAAGSTVGVLIEVDTGMDRAGVDTLEEAVALARGLVAIPGIRFEGVSGYEGHCALTPERELRHQRQSQAMSFLVETARAIEADGIPVPIVSAGGTATWAWTAAHEGITEIQAGSYLFMDEFHGPMAPEFGHALTVAATVISRPAGRLIVDAGGKSIGAGELSSIRGHDLKPFRFDEEHGIFDAPETSLMVGDVVELDPGYAPSTVNWYDAYHVVEDGRVVDIWPVIPRGPGHGGVLPALLG